MEAMDFKKSYDEMVARVVPLEIKVGHQRLDIRRKDKRLEQQRITIKVLTEENEQLNDRVDELTQESDLYRQETAGTDMWADNNDEDVRYWKSELALVSEEADKLREQIENHDMCEGCEHDKAVQDVEQRAAALAIEVTELQAENHGLREEVQRLKKNSLPFEKTTPMERKPATINKDFEEAVGSMETKVLPDGPGENTEARAFDRFESVLSDMSADELGKTYRVDRLNDQRVEFKKRGCTRILVVMPSLKSVPQWSVNGEPMKGMGEALNASRTKKKNGVS